MWMILFIYQNRLGDIQLYTTCSPVASVLWSEWVPLQEIHTTPVQQLTSSEVNQVNYLWIIVIFLSAVWTLILTAPIHC